MLSKKSSQRQIENSGGKSPLISCLEEDNVNWYSLEILLDDGWDPNHTLQENQIKYKDGRKTALFFAVRNNDFDCVDLLLGKFYNLFSISWSALPTIQLWKTVIYNGTG